MGGRGARWCATEAAALPFSRLLSVNMASTLNAGLGAGRKVIGELSSDIRTDGFLI